MTTRNHTLTTSRRTILDLLKRGGPQDAQTLANQLGVTAMAVRQHLYELEKAAMVNFTEEARTIGRPAKLWQLASASAAFYPDGHADLSVELIAAMRQAFGEDGLDKLVAIRATDQRAAYQARLDTKAGLAKKLGQLAQVRSEEGYMAEVVDQGDGDFLLVENHCPICAAATACQGLCRSELDVFRAVLGPGVSVERTEYIPLGARRCAYQIRLSDRKDP